MSFDEPPEDYGSDRSGYVEIEEGAPQDMVDAALAAACSGCWPNVFVENVNEVWRLSIAHDDHCSWMAAHEWGGGSG